MFFILDARDRGKLALSVLLQVILGFLDLLGVAVIGILGAVAVSGIESKSHGDRVQTILEFLGISTFTVQAQAAILGLAACSMLLLRTLLSILILKKTLAFLSNRSAQISSSLVSKLLASSLTKIQERTVQQTIYSTSYGVNAVALGVLGSSVALVADLSLLLTISAGLFYVDTLIAFVSVFLI
jgi:ATP-binding cassette subfamily C protein